MRKMALPHPSPIFEDIPLQSFSNNLPHRPLKPSRVRYSLRHAIVRLGISVVSFLLLIVCTTGASVMIGKAVQTVRYRQEQAVPAVRDAVTTVVVTVTSVQMPMKTCVAHGIEKCEAGGGNG
jgi:hypothetical protein